MTERLPADYQLVAFLQNPWFKKTTRRDTVERYVNDHEFRKLVLSRSASGQRLLKIFGDRYYDVWWDNSSTEVGYHRRSHFKGDPMHVVRVVKHVQPKLVIAFGTTARDTCAEARIEAIHFKHPACFDHWTNVRCEQAQREIIKQMRGWR